MTVIIFLLVLALLIFVHELGHFLLAKVSGVRVDEFALGFPPRIASFKYGETSYALNLIPFGGYVKIFGEDPNEESLSGPDKARSLVNQPKRVQALVLGAGVTFNILLAWVLFTLAFMIGFPVSGEAGQKFSGSTPHTVVTAVLLNSPAANAKITLGDDIAYVRNFSGDKISVRKPDELKLLLAPIAPRPFTVAVVSKADGKTRELHIVPFKDKEGQWIIGLGFQEVKIVKEAWYKAPFAGAVMTFETARLMILGLGDLLGRVFHGTSITEAVVGPVGIAGMVGNASAMGLVYLMTFTAFISINLAILNIVPFPALDGGRLLFLGIEVIKGSPLNPKIANTLNLIGFVLLITFMLYVTWGDIARLF